MRFLHKGRDAEENHDSLMAMRDYDPTTTMAQQQNTVDDRFLLDVLLAFYSRNSRYNKISMVKAMESLEASLVDLRGTDFVNPAICSTQQHVCYASSYRKAYCTMSCYLRIFKSAASSHIHIIPAPNGAKLLYMPQSNRFESVYPTSSPRISPQHHA